jgi:hypothetical protein
MGTKLLETVVVDTCELQSVKRKIPRNSSLRFAFGISPAGSDARNAAQLRARNKALRMTILR